MIAADGQFTPLVDPSAFDPSALPEGLRPKNPDPTGAQALARASAKESQPVPGLAHGSIPGLLGIAMNGGAGPAEGAPGLPGALWRPSPAAAFPPADMPAGAPLPFAGPNGQPAVPPAPPMLPGAAAQPRPAMPAPMPSAMPPQGAPGADAMASAPLPAPPAGAPPALPPQGGNPLLPQGSLLERMVNGIGNWRDQNRMTLLAMAGGLAGAPSIGTGIGRAFQAAGPAQMQDIALGRQNQTAQWLQSKGYNPAEAMAVATNPQLLSQLLPAMMGVNQLQHITVKDALGQEHVQVFDPRTGRVTDPMAGGGPAGVGGAGGAVGGTGTVGLLAPGVTRYDPTLPAEQYIGQFSPEMQAAIKSYMHGDVMPTGNARQASISSAAKTFAQTYGQKAGVPVSDQTYTEKRKMWNDLSASGNSSMGGIMANGESAFSHLAELGDSVSGLGNASYNFPGGERVANVQNYLGNAVLPSSATSGKIKAVNDNLGHYGQESTKFYAGTGGGVEERQAALREQNPNTSSSEDYAAYMEKEKGLMLDRMQAKFDQIRQTLGPEDAQRVISQKMPTLQQNVGRIDAAIARLRGQGAPATPQPSGGAQQQAPANAVPPPQQRQAGAKYMTPKGPATWTGTGWQLATQ